MTRLKLRRMRLDWDKRARENARHYVATGRSDWSDEDFFEAGENELRNHIYGDLGNICQGKDPKQMKVLEIGCGAARVTLPLARFFGEVHAVDISPEMVDRARRALAGFPNAHVYLNNGEDLSAVQQQWSQRSGLGDDLQVDFAYSCLVFQHIPSAAVIESYVRSVNHLLRPGGLFKFQVQGYTDKEPHMDDSWHGVPFSEEAARAMAERCGFELRYQYGAGDQYYWLWFFKVRDLDRAKHKW